MQIAVYTEGADSLAENSNPGIFREYFAGTFMSVRTLIKEFNKYGEVSVHILDDDYGYVRGADSVDAVSKGIFDRESAVQEYGSNLLQSARIADVLVVLLSKDVFVDIVVPQWETLSDLTNSADVWCLASSQKALGQLEVEACLKQDTIVYHRSGVARIGIDAKNALIELIEEHQSGTSKERVYQEFGGGFSAQDLLKSS